MLNASRRFRYTLDLKKEEEKEQIRRKIRAHAQVIRVCFQAFVSAVHTFYHHTLFPFDALVLNSIRLHYCSRKQEKSRMVIGNYQVTAVGSFCCCTHKMLSASWLRSLLFCPVRIVSRNNRVLSGGRSFTLSIVVQTVNSVVLLL